MNCSVMAGDDGAQSCRMTVANIREAEATDYIEVVFLESARFYRLPKDRENFAKSLRLLKKALEANTPLMVDLASPNSEVILNVQQ